MHITVQFLPRTVKFQRTDLSTFIVQCATELHCRWVSRALTIVTVNRQIFDEIQL